MRPFQDTKNGSHMLNRAPFRYSKYHRNPAISSFQKLKLSIAIHYFNAVFSEGKREQLMKHWITHSALFTSMIIATISPFLTQRRITQTFSSPQRVTDSSQIHTQIRKLSSQNCVWKQHWFKTVPLLTSPHTAPPAVTVVLFWGLHSQPDQETDLAEK